MHLFTYMDLCWRSFTYLLVYLLTHEWHYNNVWTNKKLMSNLVARPEKAWTSAKLSPNIGGHWRKFAKVRQSPPKFGTLSNAAVGWTSWANFKVANVTEISKIVAFKCGFGNFKVVKPHVCPTPRLVGQGGGLPKFGESSAVWPPNFGGLSPNIGKLSPSSPPKVVGQVVSWFTINGPLYNKKVFNLILL